MIDINNIKYKRIFCFGCSFTNYHKMPTWADILKLHFENTSTVVHNEGKPGVGNYYIFNKIVQTGLRYNFTKDDLILIQWSGVFREDRFKDGQWITPGNILTQSVYSTSVVNKWFFDEEGMLMRDCSYIHVIKKMLECDDLNYEMFSMNGIQAIDQYYEPSIENASLQTFKENRFIGLTSLYQDTLKKINPSMYDIVLGENAGVGEGVRLKGYKHPDYHFLPTQHLLYLEKVFQFKPSDELRTRVEKITKELLP